MAWHHEESAWLQEVWGKDRSVFPNTVRANPALWREDLMGRVFGLERDGVPLASKVKGHNYAAEYFTCDLNLKEGWKFSECRNEELKDIFEFLTPIVNPMKQTRITGKFASRVVENLYCDKSVSWAQVLEGVIAQQVKTMGPKSPKVCLSGYLAPIYKHQGLFTREEKQNYRLTERGGDPHGEEKEEEFEEGEATEVDSDPEPDTSSTKAASSKEEEPAAQEEKPPRSPPPEKPVEEIGADSEKEEPARQQSPSPARSIPDGPPGGQEAQADYSQDPHLGLRAREWSELQSQGLQAVTGYEAEMHLAKQAGYIGGLLSHLQDTLVFRAQDWEKMGKFLGCLPTPMSITSTIVKIVDENRNLAGRIKELEEKRGNLERDCRESIEELALRRREVTNLIIEGQNLRRERDLLLDANRDQEKTVNRLAGELQAALKTVKEEEGVQQSLQAATEATNLIFEVDKQVLIKKKLQMVNNGKPQAFQLLYQTIQDFSNDIIDVEERLQEEVKAT